MVTSSAIPALRDNYIWLLRGDSARVAVVDPGEAQPVADRLAAESLELAAILVTHHHWDHTGGIAELRARRDIPVFGPAADGIAGLTEPLDDHDRFEVPGVGCTLEALATPGHTRGQIAYYGADAVFTGDTLFSAGCGRLFEGTAEQMWASLTRLRALPPETRVYCGHEYTQRNLQFAAAVEPDNDAVARRQRWADDRRAAGEPTLPSTIGEEAEFNPFLRADREAVRNSAERHCGQTLNDPAAVFAALRSWKDNF
ncbi:MAG TPA: hydroxyacylglutathione hydrolase [Gammaproteobacteria bacterium]|nr:hydroxyacylglutathione hydrolase [Gammaproteobacteria bacterium]